LTIEILPKADSKDNNEESKGKWHDALISMLQECKLIKLSSISNAKLKLKSASILDLYYEAFLTETEKIVRQGLVKSYRNISENLNKVKGKINFTKHTLKNYLHKEKFFVEHKIYDENNKFNQILSLCVRVVVASIEQKSLQFDRAIERLHDNRIFTGV